MMGPFFTSHQLRDSTSYNEFITSWFILRRKRHFNRNLGSPIKNCPGSFDLPECILCAWKCGHMHQELVVVLILNP